MPREIITLQAGQCGNQSKSWSAPTCSIINVSLSYSLACSNTNQLVLNSGDKYVQNMVLVAMALWKTLPQKEGIVKMSFFTK